MTKNIKKVNFSTFGNECKIYGVDTDEYPKHHFYGFFGDKNIKKWPLQVAFAGSDETIKDLWRERKNSDTFSLEWVKKGEFKFVQNGKIYKCPANSLFIVHKNMDMRIECTSDYAIKWTIAMEGILLLPILAALNLAQVNFISHISDHDFNKIYQEIFLLTKNKNKSDNERLSVAAYELLLKLSRQVKPSAHPEKLQPALDFIEANFSEKITVKNLSEISKICVKTLNRLFHEHYGTSPLAYIIAERMKFAEILLADKNLSIKNVALKAGYQNPLYFSAEFKKHRQLSPENYRKKILKY